MKKFLLMALLLMSGLVQTAAQESEYVPFVREGVKWVCMFFWNPETTFTLELKGDCTINGQEYKAMHKYSGQEMDANNDTILIYLREEDRVVYGIVPDGKLYPEYLMGIDYDFDMEEKIRNGEEFILYDFRDPMAFIKSFIYPSQYNDMMIPDKTIINGRQVNRYIFHHAGRDYCMIEGIGYDGYMAGYPLGLISNLNDYYDRQYIVLLSHVIEDGKVIYYSEYYTQKRYDEAYKGILPITREGVQWVNERVVIDHGVTTRSYYTYEFNGVNSQGYPLCYEYTDSLANGVLVAKFVGACYDGANHIEEYTAYDQPYDNVIAEGRNMMFLETALYGSHRLYQWDVSSNSGISSRNPINYYIYHQIDRSLTRENFVEVEPLTIEDMKCRRFAHVNEQGDTMCYVVEGIGFDSRDMGDLLTPFTRRPDPDADYQEYWGLSHVIKDGKIIYKGMRYNEEHVQAMAYDINRDGTVDVADVTALIAKVLQDDNTPSFDGSGNADVGDVVRLIDYVLHH